MAEILGNYVKFVRGTQELYNDLADKNQDTLYFISERNSDTGKLYLGNKLISGSASNPSGNITINDVPIIINNESLADGDLLVYDPTGGANGGEAWVNKPIAEALQIPVMVGATASTDGVSGLVPVPVAGNQLKFLRGDGTWATVTAELSAEDRADISQLQSQVATLIGTDENKSVATIVAEKVAELLIPENASESLDTLQEIASWIQDHPSDVAEINSNITVLQSKVGALEDLLNGTENTDGLEDRVNALETTIGTFTPVPDKYLDVGSAITYFNSTITAMNDKLRWHDLTSDGE